MDYKCREYCSYSLKHLVQIFAVRPSIVRFTQCSLQKMFPHLRQWWRRRVNVKSYWQYWQLCTILSSTQFAGSRLSQNAFLPSTFEVVVDEDVDSSILKDCFCAYMSLIITSRTSILKFLLWFCLAALAAAAADDCAAFLDFGLGWSSP